MAHLLCIQFLVMLAFNSFYVSFPVYAVQGLEWSVRTTGAFFALMSFLFALVLLVVLLSLGLPRRAGD